MVIICAKFNEIPQTVFEIQSRKDNFNADGDGDADADAMVNDKHEINPACKKSIVLLASQAFLFAPTNNCHRQIYSLILQVQVGLVFSLLHIPIMVKGNFII